ncbi:trypsin-1-like [Anabrus simplex]|uniref:trypsin-1-like n=1 Tax=Anabrus simplex TaxID=316456 RepID=UPI0035A2F9E7
MHESEIGLETTRRDDVACTRGPSNIRCYIDRIKITEPTNVRVVPLRRHTSEGGYWFTESVRAYPRDMSVFRNRLCWALLLCHFVLLECPLARGSGDLLNRSSKRSVLPVTRASRDGDQRILFDYIFGLAEGGSDGDDEDEKIRNCTCQCGVANQEIRIVGGRPTGVNRYPWVARLVYDGRFHCGGSLLNSDYVLTAAHCVRRLKRSKIRVFLGDHDQFQTTDGPAIMRAVTAIIRHRNFDVNSYNHDIALLKLRKTVSFNKRIRPVCLPASEKEDPAGKVGTVVGWGRTSEGGELPGVVQEVQVPILSLDQCRKSKYRPSRITSNMLCAGRANQDSCQGDSGGPLVISAGDKHEIVGIVSWGVGCGREGYPGVYTRVQRYLEWVRRNMRDTCHCIN